MSKNFEKEYIALAETEKELGLSQEQINSVLKKQKTEGIVGKTEEQVDDFRGRVKISQSIQNKKKKKFKKQDRKVEKDNIHAVWRVSDSNSSRSVRSLLKRRNNQKQ